MDSSVAAREDTALELPLVIDVDGTLIRSDLLHEAALQLLAQHPLQSWKLPLWLLTSTKAEIKVRLAKLVDVPVETIPLREEICALMADARTSGRPVYLASASEHGLVERLADRIGGIAGVFATDVTTNMSGRAKADRLVAAFGDKGFDYVGDAIVDFDVWKKSQQVLAVSHSTSFGQKLKDAFPDAKIVGHAEVHLRDVVRALRPHQWAKNTLVFLALIAGHHFDVHSIVAAITAFLCFSMAASSAYIVNDLLDLPGDRAHHRKRHRPFAAGSLPIVFGIWLSLFLATAALALSFTLPTRFSEILAFYGAVTLAYSFVLKRKLIIDVITLGGLYTLRVLGGMSALALPQAAWLLMFSLFLFASLALVKRCSELTLTLRTKRETLIGRGYKASDLRVLISCGTAAGYGSIFVFALYLSSPEVRALYAHPDRLWLICPLLAYWIGRIFLLANRDELHDDPLVFALTDRNSLLTGACVAIVLAASI